MAAGFSSASSSSSTTNMTAVAGTQQQSQQPIVGYHLPVRSNSMSLNPTMSLLQYTAAPPQQQQSQQQHGYGGTPPAGPLPQYGSFRNRNT
jgi:hypothetical protein